jgi:hypothetical protein
MKRALSALALLSGAVQAQTDIGWLAGDWREEANGRWAEEHWSPPRGGVMLGYGRSGGGDAVRSFEFMRIEQGATGTVLIAQPGGGAPVRFALVSADAVSVVFQNPAHDYPQRIAYRRNGDTLDAETSKIDGSGVQRWRYRLLKP